MKNQQKLLGGLLLGFAVGILLAPSSGEKTRKRIMDGSVGLKNDVLSSVNGSVESLRKQFISKIDQLARGGKEAVNEASDITKV